MRKLPPLNALKSFEAAARHLSFTKAAEELFVTQAAVSHQVKALEDYVSMPLFLRRNRSLLLTEAGQNYYLDIKSILEQLTQATNKLMLSGERGSLTVSVPPSFAILWMVPRLSEFHDKFPDIDVRIKAVDDISGSLTDNIDIAIYYGRGNWPGLKSYKLHHEYLIPVCSPRLLDGPKPLASPADVLQHTLLHEETRNAWNDWFRLAELEPPARIQGPVFSHSSLSLKAAVHGQGVALANSVLAKPELDSGHLVQLFDKVLPTSDAFHLVCRESQAEIGKIATFRQWLLQVVQEEEAASPIVKAHAERQLS
ncbi:transcriptional regulator GcvA [Aliidiomarina maris]|uniref:LysR family glycine cleavage system transcriptional activator n=1 Tax=Aliidiomarina maris TaxID=531312 RepID=A0A327WXA9_9GAMM|nr:transcriptional regulator GcvA [Aliidiomarina maris]RAJ96550.1 LysR family glycine cleavage system transcriptional activator [Aliidiomarina maris]RUO23704.1 transcriptional regulator [Aliidiomarina maris]